MGKLRPQRNPTHAHMVRSQEPKQPVCWTSTSHQVMRVLPSQGAHAGSVVGGGLARAPDRPSPCCPLTGEGIQGRRRKRQHSTRSPAVEGRKLLQEGAECVCVWGGAGGGKREGVTQSGVRARGGHSSGKADPEERKGCPPGGNPQSLCKGGPASAPSPRRVDGRKGSQAWTVIACAALPLPPLYTEGHARSSGPVL